MWADGGTERAVLTHITISAAPRSSGIGRALLSLPHRCAFIPISRAFCWKCHSLDLVSAAAQLQGRPGNLIIKNQLGHGIPFRMPCILNSPIKDLLGNTELASNWSVS